MADIQTTISLYSNMEKALTSSGAAADSAAESIQSVGRAGESLETALKAATEAATDLAQPFQEASAAADKVSENIIKQQILEQRLEQGVARTAVVQQQVQTAVQKTAMAQQQVQTEVQKTTIAQQQVQTAVQKTAIAQQQVQTEVQKTAMAWQQVETEIRKTALAEQTVALEINKAATEAQRLAVETKKAATEAQRLATEEARAAVQAQKLKTEQAQTELVQSRVKDETEKAAQHQNEFAAAAGHSHMSLMDVWAVVQLISGAVKAITGIMTQADEYASISSRIALINDGLQTNAQLQDMVFQSAQNTYTAYSDMADLVTRIGASAKGLFDDNKSLVKFAELTNKALQVGGGTAYENAQALTQFTQALSSGRLQGDEMRSLLENAGGQSLLRYIAEGLDVTIGQLREMATAGELTAAKVAGALVEMQAKIEAESDSLPRTFGQNITAIKNEIFQWIGTLNEVDGPLALINQRLQIFTDWLKDAGGHAFFQNLSNAVSSAAAIIIPIIDTISAQLQRIKDFSNSPSGQAFFASLSAAGAQAGQVISDIIVKAADLAVMIMTNWTAFEPIIMGIVAALAAYQLGIAAVNIALGIYNGILAVCAVASMIATGATWAQSVAQWGLNAAMTANPIGAVVMLIAGLIGAIIAITKYIINLWNTNDKFAAGVMRVWNTVLNFFDQVPIFFTGVWNGIRAAFEYGAMVSLMIVENLCNGVIDAINWLIDKLRVIPGFVMQSLDHIAISASVAAAVFAGQAAREAELQDQRDEADKKAAEREKLISKYLDNRAQQRAEELAKEETVADAGGGISLGDGSIGIDPNYGAGGSDGIGGIKKDTGKIADISSEELKYMRDIAERDAINQFTHNTVVPQLQVSFGDVRETADINVIMSRITEMIEESLAVNAEGVHA
ncbi:MAG: tape measure protein [Clostridiales bacterium]|jgi:tape measure domain-containing protein|nr:tape measure protein [Clostridiales bacterium]